MKCQSTVCRRPAIGRFRIVVGARPDYSGEYLLSLCSIHGQGCEIWSAGEKSIVSELNDWEAWYKEEKKIREKLTRAILKSIPKTLMIPILKELKIIKRDWADEKEAYVKGV